MKLQTIGVAAAALACCGGSAAPNLQDASMCNLTVNTYNNAVSDISTRLRRYSSCVAGAQGQDDCSSEFRRLRSAQSEFEMAVSSYRLNCQ